MQKTKTTSCPVHSSRPKLVLDNKVLPCCDTGIICKTDAMREMIAKIKHLEAEVERLNEKVDSLSVFSSAEASSIIKPSPSSFKKRKEMSTTIAVQPFGLPAFASPSFALTPIVAAAPPPQPPTTSVMHVHNYHAPVFQQYLTDPSHVNGQLKANLVDIAKSSGNINDFYQRVSLLIEGCPESPSKTQAIELSKKDDPTEFKKVVVDVLKEQVAVQALQEDPKLAEVVKVLESEVKQ